MVNEVHFRDWAFEVYRQSTLETYNGVARGGADECTCGYCRNYVAYRDQLFPEVVRTLFHHLGIDFTKEVEIITWEILPNGRQQIGGWFHFKGRIIQGKDYRVPMEGGGYTYDLTPISENFSIGFAAGNEMTFFENDAELVQVEFGTSIPILSKNA